MIPTRPFFVLVVAGLVSCAPPDDSGPAVESPAGQTGAKIVFQTERDGNMELYVMNADGSDPTRLTNHPAADTYPAWSPLGDRIAFVSDRDGDEGADGNGEIYLINADGTALTRLTDNDVTDSSPRWTPDGRQLVFHSTRETGRASFTMNADGTDVRRIVPDDWVAISPSVSPDGTMVVVERDSRHRVGLRRTNESARRAQIWIVALDGSMRETDHRHRRLQRLPGLVARRHPDRLRFESVEPGSPPADIWAVGRRRHRRHQPDPRHRLQRIRRLVTRWNAGSLSFRAVTATRRSTS